MQLKFVKESPFARYHNVKGSLSIGTIASWKAVSFLETFSPIC
jgi:hypothetical protein